MAVRITWDTPSVHIEFKNITPRQVIFGLDGGFSVLAPWKYYLRKILG